jgi:threonine aldolase
MDADTARLGLDFRSDTVTWPTPEMREAMAGARVGDDVYGEDPTVNELEAEAAARVGKEAGLFVASGTMGNLVALLAHAGRGDEAIVGENAHVLQWEAGGMAVLGGIVPRVLPTDTEGRMDPERVESAVRGDDPHEPRSRLVLVENTYGAHHGAPLGPDYFAAIRRVADRHGLAVHLDGARLFNAAQALGASAADLARDVDSVTFCLSKGLCAPVGSVLCGSPDFVRRARRARKCLGGGMRQAGVLAAAGLVALRRMVGRLEEDHANARALVVGLAQIPGIEAEPERVRTNIVHFRLASGGLTPAELVRRLRDEHGILLGTDGPSRLRAVTHYYVGRGDVERFVRAVASTIGGA